MKTFTYKFRSLMVNQVEKVIPNTVFSKMVLEMDDTSIQEHTLELTAGDILSDRAWIIDFFLSLMIVLPVSGIMYGIIYFGFGKTADPSTWSTATIIYTVIATIIFLALWIFFSVRTSVGNKKRNLVEQKRGKGNWRIVNESEWEKFYRLLMIAKNQRESEKLIK